MTDQQPTHITLKTKLKALDKNADESFYIRIHRAISWLKAAEENSNDQDYQIITYWISLNACYAISGDSHGTSEKTKLTEFLEKLVNVDRDRIYNLFWFKFSGVIRILLDNQYIYGRYWRFLRGEVSSWETEFDRENQAALRLLQSPDRSVDLISLVMGRLYVMRNQLLHGGATHGSRVNREQIRDCSRFLGHLIPLIIDIMIDHPDEAWGEIYYPVVNTRTDAKER